MKKNSLFSLLFLCLIFVIELNGYLRRGFKILHRNRFSLSFFAFSRLLVSDASDVNLCASSFILTSMSEFIYIQIEITSHKFYGRLNSLKANFLLFPQILKFPMEFGLLVDEFTLKLSILSAEWTTTLLFHLRPFLLLSLLPFNKTHITKDSVTRNSPNISSLAKLLS